MLSKNKSYCRSITLLGLTGTQLRIEEMPLELDPTDGVMVSILSEDGKVSTCKLSAEQVGAMRNALYDLQPTWKEVDGKVTG